LWSFKKYLGEIPQVNQTYNVVGNGNEYGLVIGESTFGGVQELAHQPGAIIDYGSLIYLTLQRSKTARDAIKTMNHLMDTYGYASQGESLSIADATGEVWIMEIIGRGDTYGKLGAVWVAFRIPDGYISAHANQARITTFPRDEADFCMYASDVVDVAVHYGLYPKEKDPKDFSFSDTYDPVGFSNARFSEARVWSIFSSLADTDGAFQLHYQEYASGRDVSKRMPLFIKPYKKLSVLDVMNVMNSHYEGTELDSSKDVGAGSFESPYRPRPLEWEYKGTKYHNERSIATVKTGWNFVAQIRPHMPRELAAILWFAVDDSSTSPRVPVYTSSRDVAPAYAGKGTQDGIPGPMLQFDMEKAFWVQNMVSNFCYSRWSDIYPMVRKRIDDIHTEYVQQLKLVDDNAQQLYKDQSPEAALDYVTQYTVSAGTNLHQVWLDFYGELFVRFRDFSTIVPKPDETRCGCEVQEPGMSDAVKRRIALETGSQYELPKDSTVVSDPYAPRLNAPRLHIHAKDVA
jgi:dipeptidase